MTLKTISLVGFIVIAGLIVYSFQSTEYPKLEMQVSAAPAGGHHVLIFGATRNTGLEAARILTARGNRVTAFVRPGSDRSLLEPLGVEFVSGDALEKDTVTAAFTNNDYTSVLTTISCFRCDPKPDFLGNRNIFDAAATTGVQRVLLVSTIGAGDSYETAPWLTKKFLSGILPLKTQAEDYLISTGLNYTIIRPGGLKSDPPTGRAYLSESRNTMGIINRADLADLIVQAIDDNSTSGKILAAVDADLVFPWDMF